MTRPPRKQYPFLTTLLLLGVVVLLWRGGKSQEQIEPLTELSSPPNHRGLIPVPSTQATAPQQQQDRVVLMEQQNLATQKHAGPSVILPLTFVAAGLVVGVMLGRVLSWEERRQEDNLAYDIAYTTSSSGDWSVGHGSGYAGSGYGSFDMAHDIAQEYLDKAESFFEKYDV
jgi:hypothetical protein